MKKVESALILAGGKGTRFSEYTKTIPKPMISAKGKPLLDHIINIFSQQNVNNFLVLAGYKADVISNHYKINYEEIGLNKFKINEQITVHILDTGIETQTGGRIKQALEYLDDEYFFLTYGDGLANVDLDKLIDFHFENETLGTVTAVRPPARFGSLEINDESFVTNFGEKNIANEGWINGGFFILNRKIGELITNDSTFFEREPLEALSKQNELKAFKHFGYWRPVDTIRELEILEKEMEEGKFKYYEK